MRTIKALEHEDDSDSNFRLSGLEKRYKKWEIKGIIETILIIALLKSSRINGGDTETLGDSYDS